MTPPSEVIRPPSNAAVIFLRPTAGNENGSNVSSVMAGGSQNVGDRNGFSTKILRHINRLSYIRQPLRQVVVHKTG
ncbi:MAG: hypothetical protein ABIQ51_04135, partial [Mesorhizobium sp.]